ncbi:MAG: hypothetical protein AAES65_10865 [Candidatus Thiodiazotropha sp. (ex. Lucinoma kazani)]
MRYLDFKTFLLLLALPVLLVSPVTAEDLKKPKFSLDRDAVQSRIDNVNRLVNTSSGARRVAEGGEKAKSLRNQASKHLDKAKLYFQSNNMELANDELQQATLTMFQAIRLVGTGKVGEDKLRDDYAKKRKSLSALLDALERVSLEKHASTPASDTITAQAEAADRLVEQGKIKDARVQLDKAYELVKQEVEKLRSGDTLVRTLEFSSNEEEYAYELDRNETHFMLVKLLLEDRVVTASTQSAVDEYIQEAQKLRGMAENASNAGDSEQGIQYLEESTKHIVRAIRRAGVYIPG